MSSHRTRATTTSYGTKRDQRARNRDAVRSFEERFYFRGVRLNGFGCAEGTSKDDEDEKVQPAPNEIRGILRRGMAETQRHHIPPSDYDYVPPVQFIPAPKELRGILRRDEDNGKSMMDSIMDRVYKNPHCEQMPDILAFLRHFDTTTNTMLKVVEEYEANSASPPEMLV